jgi:hypothetical protein
VGRLGPAGIRCTFPSRDRRPTVLAVWEAAKKARLRLRTLIESGVAVLGMRSRDVWGAEP